MRLKSIKLAGFKSFVDPTTVNFPGNLSAVVGPNGCGKSNIIDAVRWVMGESSAKNLRGESMTDVIFNGSGGRKPVGQASIELVFDNSDGAIGGEYASFAEVSIKRRVTRDAQNHYFLNGQKCRRRDITDIFLGTGLGPRSYAIIEQGMISRLIESKPEELRVFIEEAAGISKYKERRKETENRMKRTLENLERLTDIRDELERQLQHLHRQSVAAEKYTTYKAEERQLTAQLQALEWKTLDDIFQSGASQIDQLALALEAVVTEQTALEAEVETLLTEQTAKRDAFNDAQSRYYSLGADIAKAEQIIQNHKQSEARLKQDLSDVSSQLNENNRLVAEDEDKLDQFTFELEELAPELEILLETETENEEEQTQLEDALQIWQEEWDQFNQTAASAQQKVEVQQSRIQHAETVIRRLNDKQLKLKTELDSQGHHDSEDDIALLDAHIITLTEQLVALEEQQDAHQATIESLREDDDNQSSEINQLQATIQQQQGRLASLEALQQAALDDQNERLTKWLETNDLVDKPRLTDNLSVDTGFEHAVETVLADKLQAICVDDLNSLSAHLSTLDNAAVCLVSAGSHHYQGQYQGEALADKTSGNAYIKPFLAGIYLAESFEKALSQQSQLAANESFITPDGLWIGPNWIKKSATKDASVGIIARKAEIEALTKTLDEHQHQLTEKQTAHKILRETLTEAEHKKTHDAAAIKQLNQQKSAKESELFSKKSKIEQMIAAKARLVADIGDTNEQLALEEETLSESRAILESAIEAMQLDADKREQLTAKREALRGSLDAARDRIRQHKDKVQQLSMQKQSLSTNIASLTEQKSRLSGQIEHILMRKTQIEESLGELNEPDEDLNAELEVLLDKRLAAEEALSEAQDIVNGIDERMRSAEMKRNQLQQKNTDVRSELEKSRIAAQGIEVKRDELQKQLNQGEFNLDEVLANMPEDADKKVWEEELERLGNRISRLGAINLAAIEEYKVASERKHYLDAQNSDLEKALGTLENAIKKIDKETRFKFKETFDKINAGVQELFPKVFGGGRAYITMTGEDLLDTGVAIMAQPPGKKNSTIHLLSGGEKALTAIALVFSIFRLNPAPFCMLDEVDAPLDDANVGRYARMVEEMSKTVQFIYITHNKIAMEKATHLLGVTMHEPGVSRMVTVDVEEAVELAAQ